MENGRKEVTVLELRSLRPYKSVLDLNGQLELPDFSIVTGLNGSGKTQLLEGILNGRIAVLIEGQTVPTDQIQKFDWNNLVPPATPEILPGHVVETRDKDWTTFAQNQLNMHRAIEGTLEETKVKRKTESVCETLRRVPISELPDNVARTVSAWIGNSRKHFGEETRILSILDTIVQSSSVPLFCLDKATFDAHYPINYLVDNPFQMRCAELFLSYSDRRNQNTLKRVLTAEGHAEYQDHMSDSEFLVKHGKPPWEVIDALLEAAHLDYRVCPPRVDAHPYKPKLRHKSSGQVVSFEDLSSGEKILVSLVFCIYHADGDQSVNYPRIVLFDEVDAPLHPSMTTALLRAISDVLVAQHSARVLLTTHSPSTVALAPEGALFSLRRETDAHTLKKQTKDAALRILTTGVPTLSIDFEGRRQVFTESKYDAEAYSAIFQLLKEYRASGLSPGSLEFLSSGVAGVGNCDQVREIVKNLRGRGNLTVYGIIDWDCKNISEGPVFVLGENEAYSLENLLLDPLIVASLLLRERLVTPETLDLPREARFYELHKECPSVLSRAAAIIVSEIGKHTSVSIDPSVTVDRKDVGGLTIRVPRDYLLNQGHDLERALKDAYPPLKRFHQEFSLKREVVGKVLPECPAIIPSGFLTIFNQILSANRED